MLPVFALVPSPKFQKKLEIGVFAGFRFAVKVPTFKLLDTESVTVNDTTMIVAPLPVAPRLSRAVAVTT